MAIDNEARKQIEALTAQLEATDKFVIQMDKLVSQMIKTLEHNDGINTTLISIVRMLAEHTGLELPESIPKLDDSDESFSDALSKI